MGVCTRSDSKSPLSVPEDVHFPKRRLVLIYHSGYILSSERVRRATLTVTSLRNNEIHKMKVKREKDDARCTVLYPSALLHSTRAGFRPSVDASIIYALLMTAKDNPTCPKSTG